jgi:hypothetical protein
VNYNQGFTAFKSDKEALKRIFIFDMLSVEINKLLIISSLRNLVG